MCMYVILMIYNTLDTKLSKQIVNVNIILEFADRLYEF